MSELTNALSNIFVKEDDELKKAKQCLLGAINIVAEFFPSDWSDQKREEEMNNLMGYYNNFEELMGQNGFTVQECLKYACREIGYIN